MENVASHLTMGFGDVLGSLAQIGYDAEWTILSAQQFGAPHLRRRLFIVAYPGGESDERGTTPNSNQNRIRTSNTILSGGTAIDVYAQKRTTPNSNGSTNGVSGKDKKSDRFSKAESTTIHKEDRGWKKSRGSQDLYNPSSFDASTHTTDSNSTFGKNDGSSFRIQKKYSQFNNELHRSGFGYWEKTAPPSPFCGMDDGVPNRVDRLRALGNAIVPQCSEWIGQQIWNSGLLQEIK